MVLKEDLPPETVIALLDELNFTDVSDSDNEKIIAFTNFIASLNAVALLTNGAISPSAAIAQSKIASLVADLAAKEVTANKDAVNGYAGLDGSSKLNGSQQVYGSSVNTAAEGNDSRLSDARTPLAHTHAQSDITDLTTDLAAKFSASNRQTNIVNSEIDAAAAIAQSKIAGLVAALAAKASVDSVQAKKWKEPARVATTANITLTGEQTIDGITTSADRILVKNQTSGAENGIYVTDAGAWTRATDWDVDGDAEAAFTFVREGTVNGLTLFKVDTTGTITIGTTVVVITEFGNSIGTHTQWIPAGAWGKVTTNGAEFGELELPTNDIMLQTFDFDNIVSEKIQFWWEPPAEWDGGTITFNAKWTAGAGSGTVIWTLSGHSYSNGDAIDVAIGGTPGSTAADTLSAVNQMQNTAESANVTIAGATKAEAILLQLVRDISDTLSDDAKLVGINITFTTDEATKD